MKEDDIYEENRTIREITALVIYLIITAIFSFVFEKIEKRFSLYE